VGNFLQEVSRGGTDYGRLYIWKKCKAKDEDLAKTYFVVIRLKGRNSAAVKVLHNELKSSLAG
jgi:hypothetical protein